MALWNLKDSQRISVKFDTEQGQSKKILISRRRHMLSNESLHEKQ